MKKYKEQKNVSDSQESQSEQQKCDKVQKKTSCLQTEPQSIIRIDLKQFNNHKIIKSDTLFEFSNNGNYFSIFNPMKWMVGIFNIPKKKFMNDINIRQPNQTARGCIVKNIKLRFSITSQYLIIKNTEVLLIVDLENCCQQAPQTVSLPNKEYQIEETDNVNQLYLSYYKEESLIIRIYQLKTGIILKQILVPFDKRFWYLQHKIIVWGNNTFLTLGEETSCLRSNANGKIISIRRQIDKRINYFCLSKMNNRFLLTNIFNGKLIKNVLCGYGYFFYLQDIYIADNDLIVQILLDEPYMEKSKRKTFLEFHCFKFQKYQYWPKKWKQINTTTAANILKSNSIEFYSF